MKPKTVVLVLTMLLQVMAIVYFFIDVVTAIYLFAFHIVGWIIIFVLLIMERIKEKREEDDNDYRNY